MSINSFSGPYRFLSNFWPAIVVLDSQPYPSVEHAYQAAKTLDSLARLKIAGAPTPGAAKRAGRGVALRADWEQVKLSIMENLLRQKFGHHGMRDALLATGNLDLIEGNHWGDRFWGVCRGSGENHLGRLLMKIRAELR